LVEAAPKLCARREPGLTAPPLDAIIRRMSAKKVWIGLALLLGATACAVQAGGPGRIVYYPAGCADRLVSGYKQAECMACVNRAYPGAYYPDQPDGTRCRGR
jgi:hypothetical protein